MAAENFKKINEAYSVLSNSEKRARYDKFGKSGINEQAGMSQQQAQEMFKEFFGKHVNDLSTEPSCFFLDLGSTSLNILLKTCKRVFDRQIMDWGSRNVIIFWKIM